MVLSRDSWRAVVSTLMNIQISQNTGIFFNNRGTVSVPRRTVSHGVNSPLFGLFGNWGRGGERCQTRVSPS